MFNEYSLLASYNFECNKFIIIDLRGHTMCVLQNLLKNWTYHSCVLIYICKVNGSKLFMFTLL